jgi:hypothetical protein
LIISPPSPADYSGALKNATERKSPPDFRRAFIIASNSMRDYAAP